MILKLTTFPFLTFAYTFQLSDNNAERGNYESKYVKMDKFLEKIFTDKCIFT